MRCNGPKLNGADVILRAPEGDAICKAITGKTWLLMGGNSTYEAAWMSWNGTTWALETRRGTPMGYLECEQ